MRLIIKGADLLDSRPSIVGIAISSSLSIPSTADRASCRGVNNSRSSFDKGSFDWF